MILVEVVYAGVREQVIKKVSLAEGGTVRDAIEASGVLEAFPEIDLAVQPVGIFSQKVELTQSVKDGDRVEIYRPLVIDPKAARRLRAAKKKST